MTLVRAARAQLALELADDLDPQLRDLCTHELDALADSLAPWGRFSTPVRVESVARMSDLARAASAPVDGLLCAVAELTRVVLLAPPAWHAAPTVAELRVTLTHELAHTLLFQRCHPPGRTAPVALPTWFREGMAVHAAEGPPPAAVLRRLPSIAQLDALADADATLVGAAAQPCYDLAHLLFDRWHRDFGDRRLAALCRAMRVGHAFEDAFVQACGQRTRDWRDAAIRALRG